MEIPDTDQSMSHNLCAVGEKGELENARVYSVHFFSPFYLPTELRCM